jgi:hypothetical protein
MIGEGGQRYSSADRADILYHSEWLRRRALGLPLSDVFNRGSDFRLNSWLGADGRWLGARPRRARC